MAAPEAKNATGYSKAFAGSTGSNSIGNYAWTSENSASKTHEVGKKLPNELGLYDMSGNVWEWCWDWFGGSYGASGTIGDSGLVTDYTGAAAGSYRVMRGGAWFNGASFAACAYRGDNSPSNWSDCNGIRLVCR